MTFDEREFIDAMLRSDFQAFLRRCLLTLNPGAPFLPNWHIEAIAHQLDRIRRGEIKRLIINMPPRHLKSITVSVAFSAFLLGLEPWHRLFVISYGQELSSKHSADFRSIVESDWFRRAFRDMSIARSLEDEIQTTARGFRKSTSVNGTLTGLGGDIFIIDDPQKPIDAQSESQRTRLNQWVSNTLMSRLDNQETSAIIVVMQRVHLNDLTGYLTDEFDDWEVLSLAAIAEVEERIPIGKEKLHNRYGGEALHPEHLSLEALEKLRENIGTDVFLAQYQQTPVPAGGAMIKRAWLRYYEHAPARGARAKIIQSWDTAAKEGSQNDWSVCTTWLLEDKHYFLLDLIRGRFEYPRLRATALATAQRFKPDVILVEDSSIGTALGQELKSAQFGLAVRLQPVHRDKQSRLYVHQAKFEAGLVHLPKNAHYLSVLEAELLTFPQCKTDDQVDSVSQALSFERPRYGMLDVQ